MREWNEKISIDGQWPSYLNAPKVAVFISGFEHNKNTEFNLRVSAHTITTSDFYIYFKTWGNSKFTSITV